jgi:anti-sigma regulatory factor (Ser/Thr protein kinase)
MDDSATRTDRRLVLEPHPSSAAAARRWVRQELQDAGLDGLTESAELAISELVTNAILHAQTSITVVVEGLSDGWRIAVRDLSPSTVAPTEQSPGQVWSSGRGLQILSAITRRWGVDDDPPGKRVWFEPRDEAERAAPPDPDATDAPRSPHRRGRDVVLRRPPLTLLRQARRRFTDLHREMLLLSFADAEDAPPRLVELARTIEPIAADLLGDDRLNGDGETLVYRLPPEAADLDVRSWADLFDEADGFCRDGHLLTLATPRGEARARRWFLTEVARQTSGLPPTAWPDYADD